MQAKITFLTTQPFRALSKSDPHSRYKLMKEEEKQKKGLMVANINHLFTFQSAEILFLMLHVFLEKRTFVDDLHGS